MKMASCKYCGAEISWLKDGRKNIPVNLDGTPHECAEFKSARKSVRKMDRTSLSPEEIAKYEKAINKKK